MLQLLFSLTLFISAALLFWIQLITSKMLLPILGGSAAVWNTCMMFFQIALLLGYLYAHVTNRRLRSRFGVFLHPLLLLLAAIVLPVSLHEIQLPAGDANPIIWLLRTLLVLIGPPFLILAGTAPLLQTWFAQAGQKSSRDPYFLYAASNLGSLGALLSYPTLIEPHLPLTQQNQYWTIGYFLLIGLTVICAGAMGRQSRTNLAGQAVPDVSDLASGKPGTWERLHWVLLAFVPSSLLLGVTTHLTTDVAAAPLFWIVPLVLYLLTFVLAFQRLIRIPEAIVAPVQATLMVTLAAIFLSNLTNDVISLFALHLTVFFVTALSCHLGLARRRPPVKYLTEFYLLLSLGGALGGVFNALLAPLLFNDVIEYPLILVVACLLRPGILPRLKAIWPALGDFALPACIFLLLVLLDRYGNLYFQDLDDSRSLIALLIIALVVFAFQQRPIRFGLGIAAIIAAGFMISDTNHILAQSRNFYGVLKVVAQRSPPLHALYNGTTLHGSQAEDPNHRLEPLTYYHPEGPLGQLFAAIGGTAQTQRVGLVGLGAGTVACYEKPGERWTFFEINPADIAIAGNPALFTFLKDCPAHPDIVLGDARLSLAQQPDNAYDMIILDAFTSDAIPIHLITREAVQLYLRKLHAGGLIVFHISNQHLDLGPVVANVAASLNLTARRWIDLEDDEDDDDTSYKRAGSDWVIVARNVKDLRAIKDDDRWKPLPSSPGKSVWTDDYSNLLGALIY